MRMNRVILFFVILFCVQLNIVCDAYLNFNSSIPYCARAFIHFAIMLHLYSVCYFLWYHCLYHLMLLFTFTLSEQQMHFSGLIDGTVS